MASKKHGGKREGAGRPKGAKNKVSIKRTSSNASGFKVKRKSV